MCFLALSSFPGYLLHLHVCHMSKFGQDTPRSFSTLPPHCVYLTIISHIMSYSPRLVTYFCLLHKFLKNQGQFVRMHSIDRYSLQSSHLDNHGVSGCSFILESIFSLVLINPLVSWSVARQKSHHQMLRRHQLQKQVHGFPIGTLRCGIGKSAEIRELFSCIA